LGTLTLLVLFFYGADFAQFAYVNARLNADALIFAEDPKESLQMVWQSYPIVWILISLILAVILINRLFKRTHDWVEERNVQIHKFDYRRRWHLACILTLCWFAYGFMTFAPLNFQRAFRLNEEFKSNLALNPLQNFFTTLQFRKPDYTNQAGKYYDRIARFLQLDENTQIQRTYRREQTPDNHALESQPNIILIICESFSMYKSSMSGNPLNATPYFNSLCQKGIFFERCFSPSFGTARGVFATITGIPDVQLSKFSTRNEASVHQRTIINDLEGYDKYYFIGGNSEFNNFSGLIKNIHGVKIIDEKSYTQPKVNVWGISDKDLLLEANRRLRENKKPFFAIIQTADNHRPFAIPTQDSDFVKRDIHPDSLHKYGFESIQEFHAFGYMDYCISHFIETASQEKYFENTVFVFVGDHGVEGNASALYPEAWTEQRLSDEHIPLLFYAPYLLTPARRKETISQIDVMPTIAGLLQQTYTNTTLGRDVMAKQPREHAAFIMYHAPGWIGVVTDRYFYRKNIRIKKDELVPADKGIGMPDAQTSDSLRRELSLLTDAIYQTSKWMLLNNRKD
jgi:phosphoglycerol transferase MdoB-like AlkP superfamily enzyme